MSSLRVDIVLPAVALYALLSVLAACGGETEETRDIGDGGSGVGGGGGGLGTGTGTDTTTGTGTGTGTSTGTGSDTNTGTDTGVCTDIDDESNDTESSAIYLGAIDDHDGSGGIVEGTLNGNDTDWYFYDGADVAGAFVDATVDVMAASTVRVCQFFECDGIMVDCPEDTTPETSPSGRPGCCSSMGFDLAPDCSAVFDQSSTVYIRLDKPPAIACVDYSLAYHY